jgi:hypothetical protein
MLDRAFKITLLLCWVRLSSSSWCQKWCVTSEKKKQWYIRYSRFNHNHFHLHLYCLWRILAVVIEWSFKLPLHQSVTLIKGMLKHQLYKYAFILRKVCFAHSLIPDYKWTQRNVNEQKTIPCSMNSKQSPHKFLSIILCVEIHTELYGSLK